MKKENKRMLVLVIILSLIILIAVIGTVSSKITSDKVVDEVKQLINKKGNNVVYFMSENCSYCNLYEYAIEEMEEYGVEFTKIDISKLSEDQIGEIVYYLEIGKLDDNQIEYLEETVSNTSLSEETKNEYIKYINQNTIEDDNLNEIKDKMSNQLDEDEYETFATLIDKIGQYGTPNITIVGDGKIKSKLDGYNNTKDLFNYLKESKMIDSSKQLPLSYVNLEQLNNELDKDGKHVVVIAKSTCSYCLKYHKTLNEVAEQNNLEILYVNMDTIVSSDDEYNELIESYPWIDSITGTPATFIIENNESVDFIEGYNEPSDLKVFLKSNKILK